MQTHISRSAIGTGWMLIMMLLLGSPLTGCVFQSDLPPALPPQAREALFQVEAMHCSTCPTIIDISLKSLPGVYRVRIDMPEEKVWVYFDPEEVSTDLIAEKITEIGYPAKLRELI